MTTEQNPQQQPMINPENVPDLILEKTTTTPRNPLKDFEGVLTSVTGEYRKLRNNNTVLDVKLSFAQVKVHATHPGQVYPHPVAEVVIPHSESKQSMYAVLANSIAEVIGKPTTFRELYGRRIRMAWTGGHEVKRMNQQTKQWDTVKIDAWEVITIDGLGKGSDDTTPTTPSTNTTPINELAVSIADGKNALGFGKALLTTPGVPTELKQISIEGQETTYLDALVKQGMLTVDASGTYHKA